MTETENQLDVILEGGNSGSSGNARRRQGCMLVVKKRGRGNKAIWSSIRTAGAVQAAS